MNFALQEAISNIQLRCCCCYRRDSVKSHRSEHVMLRRERKAGITQNNSQRPLR